MGIATTATERTLSASGILASASPAAGGATLLPAVRTFTVSPVRFLGRFGGLLSSSTSFASSSHYILFKENNFI